MDEDFEKVIDWMNRAIKNDAVLMKPKDYAFAAVRLLKKYITHKDWINLQKTNA